MASAVSNLLIYQGSDFIIDFTVENDNGTDSVSYTHLTLPTNREV